MTTFTFPREVKKALGRLVTVKSANQKEDLTEIIYNHCVQNASDPITFSKTLKAQQRAERYRFNVSKPIKDASIINTWKRSDFESWYRVMIIAAETEGQAEQIAGKYLDLEGFSSTYPGQPFAHPACVYQFGYNRYLVTQRGGLDV